MKYLGILLALALFVLTPTAGASGKLEQDDLEAVSLRITDVPAGFFINQPRERALSSSRAPKTAGFEMCVDKDGHKVFGRAPNLRVNSAISLYQKGTGEDIEATRAVSSDVFQYSTVARARAAWEALLVARDRCAPTVTMPIEAAGGMVAVDVVQILRDLPTRKTSAGYSNAQDVSVAVGEAASGGLNIWVDGFTVYRAAGLSIIRVQFADYSTESLAGATLATQWKIFTAREAMRIVRRIAAIT